MGCIVVVVVVDSCRRLRWWCCWLVLGVPVWSHIVLVAVSICCSSGGVICCCGLRCLVFVVTVPSLVVLVAVSFAVVVFVVWCLVVPVPSLVALL